MSKRVALRICAACASAIVVVVLLQIFGGSVAGKIADVLLMVISVALITALIGTAFRRARE